MSAGLKQTRADDHLRIHIDVIAGFLERYEMYTLCCGGDIELQCRERDEHDEV